MSQYIQQPCLPRETNPSHIGGGKTDQTPLPERFHRSPRAVHAEVAPHIRCGAEVELLDDAASRLESLIGILRRDAHSDAVSLRWRAFLCASPHKNRRRRKPSIHEATKQGKEHLVLQITSPGRRVVSQSGQHHLSFKGPSLTELCPSDTGFNNTASTCLDVPPAC